MGCNVVSADRVLERAVALGLITSEEAATETFQTSAEYAAAFTNGAWREGCGFGSSDFTAVLAAFLRYAGVRTTYVNFRLTRVS